MNAGYIFPEENESRISQPETDENGTAFTRRRQLFCLETKIPVSIDQFTSNNCIGTAYQSKVLTNLVCYEGFRQQIRKLFASKVG